VAGRAEQLTEKDLSQWKLLDSFQEALAPVLKSARLHATFADPERELSCSGYLSLFLFGLFNPVVESMRGICAISSLKKVRKTTGCGKVSLGSFSEAQHVLDPDLLKQVFERLVEQAPGGAKRDPQLAHLELIAQDGSLWRALPRMAWAEYGVGPKGMAKGVRMHLRFNVLKDCPSDVQIGVGKSSETQALRDMLVPNQTTVADRLYGQDYQLFAQIQQAKAFFVFRINESAVIEVDQELPVTAADQAAGVVRHAWVYLGATQKLRSIRLRLVEVKKDGQHLLIVTNHPVETVPAQLVSLIYRRRWSIELFFRWVKCVLGCRHFLAESERGVAIQLYLALIAALLLQFFIGQRPNKRMMELLQFYLMGWASAEEVAALIQQQAKAKPASGR
jgi:hypothetical protein